MAKHSSPKHSKYNRKTGWLAGMFHLFNFHNWRTKNRPPICWRTPRTHSLAREQEPFLNVVAEKQTREMKKMMTTKYVTEYVDFLETLRKEDVFVKVLNDPNSKFWKQVQIKSSSRALPKSSTFPLSHSSRRPARIEHKQSENWFAPKQNETVLTLNVPTNTSQGHSVSNDHGFNHAVMSGFREIKKFLKNALKDRKHIETKKKKYSDDSMGRYYHLLEKSFRREGSGELGSKSLRLSFDSRDDNKPQFFRRVSSLSRLETLGSFLTELPRDSSASSQETRKSLDRDSYFGSKKSENPVRTEKEEEKEPNQIILQEVLTSALSIEFSDDTTQKEETSHLQSLSFVDINNHKKEEEAENIYFCYVKKVLKHSGFLENKVEKWHSEEHPLNPSLLYEILEEEEEEEVEKELLFDLVNEVIFETESQSQIYFPTKTLSFAYGKRFLDEVWRRVKWSLYSLGDEIRDRSLDDIVGRDLAKSDDGWMNLQGECEWLILELEDMVFDEVLDEILCFY